MTTTTPAPRQAYDAPPAHARPRSGGQVRAEGLPGSEGVPACPSGSGPSGGEAGALVGVVDLSGLPQGLARAVAAVVQGARASTSWPRPAARATGADGVGAEAPVDLAGPHTPPAPTRAQAKAALGVLEAVEVAKAALDAVAVRAAGVVAAQYELHLLPEDPGDLSFYRRAQLLCGARDGAALEIQTATGLSTTAARRLVRYARAGTTRTQTTTTLVVAGTLSLDRAATLLEQSADLPPDHADQLAARVLRPLHPTTTHDAPSRGVAVPQSGTGQVPISAATFTRRLHRERCRATADTGADEHAAAIAARRTGITLADDGTATFYLTGAVPRTVAAHRRIDQIARHHGDPRTLDQLRSDITLDLLLYGWVPTTDPTDATDSTAPREGHHDGRAHGRGEVGDAPEQAQPEPEAVPFATTEAPGPDPATRGFYRAIGEPPPASVQIIVSLDTLLGTDEGLGELPGHGFLSAAQTRAAALAAGSTWTRLVTDPATGHLLDLSTTAYHPTPTLTAQVHARDHHCRGPGCTIPAAACDFDHNTNHADGGPTTTSNGSAKHRRHHNLKTRRLWHTTQHPDGAITWTTLLARTYTTTPHDYRELNDAPETDDDTGTHTTRTALPTPDDPPPF